MEFYVDQEVAAYFNSHPRVGGDDYGDQRLRAESISTHTPAWGVTVTAFISVAKVYFNSHPRVGGDTP